ncbi:hypothetical protein FEB19_16985 [Salmonella enterica]|nr:hypothetical protein [Salmonella enterica]
MNWIDIPGCAGFYQAHPNGVIRSTDRKVRDENNGKILSVKGRELKPQINRRGYLTYRFVLTASASKFQSIVSSPKHFSHAIPLTQWTLTISTVSALTIELPIFVG